MSLSLQAAPHESRRRLHKGATDVTVHQWRQWSQCPLPNVRLSQRREEKKEGMAYHEFKTLWHTQRNESATQFSSCASQQSLLSPAQLCSQQILLSFFQLDFTLCIRHTCSILRPVIENKDDDINHHQQGPRPQGPFLIRMLDLR